MQIRGCALSGRAVRAPDMVSKACLTTTYGDGTSPTSVLWFILPVVSEQRLICVEPVFQDVVIFSCSRHQEHVVSFVPTV